MTAGWRYHALRILDRTWLHRDLPLSDVTISPALSGPGAMSATLAPEIMSAQTAPTVVRKTSPYKNTVLADSPSLYWRLGEASGGLAADASGNGHSGTYAGGVARGASSPLLNDSDAAADFNGTDGRVTSSYAPFAGGTVRTVEGWAWRDANGTNDVLFAGDSGGTAPLLRLEAGLNDVRFWPDSTSASATWAGAWPGTGQWVHWALTFDEPHDTAELFINGVSRGALSQAVPYSATPGTFQIGARSTTTDPFDGKMDEVAVYEHALPAERVQAHYAAASGGTTVVTPGAPLLQEWRDLIVAEAADQVRFAGILVGSEFTGEAWSLDIAGFSAWPQGQPQVATKVYGTANVNIPGGPISGQGADPIQIVKDLWTQLQAQPDGDLGVTFGGDSVCKHRLARWYNVPNKWDYHPDASTTVEVVAYGSKSLDELKTTDLVKVVVSGTGFTKKLKTKQDKGSAGSKPVYWLHHVYDYENTDLGDKINTYAKASPFDYLEHAEWADPDKSDVVLRLDFGYPRIGTRRLGLRFAEGENISELITVRRDGEDYANGVLAFGAGEGKDQLRELVVQRDGRVRRIKVITNTGITSRSQLRAMARAELNAVNELTDIQGFTVAEHPHAPYGSYRVGDDVPVHVATGWAAGTSLWVRITGLTYQPDNGSVQVQCTRSDSFTYGSVSTT